MKIAVCVKQILDPELPPSAFEIDSTLMRATIGKHAHVIDPYSGNALELALQLKDKRQDVQVTAMTFGNSKAEDTLRKCLGVLADEAVHVLNGRDIVADTYATAKILAAAIKRTGPFDLILCGRQAGDWDLGLLGSLLGETLSIPSVCFASKLDFSDIGIKIQRYVDGGTQVLEAKLPVLVTVTNDEFNVIRIAKVKDVMRAHRKPIQRFEPEQLGLSESEIGQVNAHAGIESLFIPKQISNCEIIEGEEPQAKVETLLSRLKENKVF
jgi:electron transfer flavoprotein beta subunit